MMPWIFASIALVLMYPAAAMSDDNGPDKPSRAEENAESNTERNVTDEKEEEEEDALSNAQFPDVQEPQKEEGPLNKRHEEDVVKREEAKTAYLKGRWFAEEKNDYVSALRYFKRAQALVQLPLIVFAIAQCRRSLGHDIEALFLFAETLKANNEASTKDRMDTAFIKAVKSNMDDLMKRFVEVHVIAPQNTTIEDLGVDGVRLAKSNLSNFLSEEKRFAGVTFPVANSQARISRKSIEFLIKPGTYHFEIVLSDKRKLHIEKKYISARHTDLDLNRSNLPSKLVVKNIQPGTRVVLNEQIGPTTEKSILDETYPDRKEEVALSGLKSGQYNLKVSRRRFEDYKVSYSLYDGQKKEVILDLNPEPSITKSWKFWLGMGGGAAVLIAGAATVAVLVAVNNDEAEPTGLVSVDLSSLDK